MVTAGEWTNGPNILGLIMFAIVLGVSLAKLEENLIDTQSWQIGEQWSGFRYLQIASFTLNKFNLLEKLYKLDKLFPL